MPSRYGSGRASSSARGGQRRGDHLEVDGAVGVGEDEFVAAVGDEYCTLFLARRDDARGGASGSARSIRRCSEVSWSPPAITQSGCWSSHADE